MTAHIDSLTDQFSKLQLSPTEKTSILRKATDAPWMKKGLLVDRPCALCKDEFLANKSFLQTPLGKKAVGCAKFYAQKQQIQKTAEDMILKRSTEHGTCLGESYALMIAYSKMQAQKKDIPDLLKMMEKSHVVFFQLLEDFTEIQFSYSNGKPTHVERDVNIETCSLKKLKKFSSFQRVSRQFFNLKEKGAFHEVVKTLFKINHKVVEIGLFWKNQAHSILAIFTTDFLFYDCAEIGLAIFPSKQALIADTIRFFRSLHAQSSLQVEFQVFESKST